MRKAIIAIIPGAVAAAAGKVALGRGLVGAGLGLVAKRIAMASVPGAVVVGGVLAAKFLIDRKQADSAKLSDDSSNSADKTPAKRARIASPSTPKA